MQLWQRPFKRGGHTVRSPYSPFPVVGLRKSASAHTIPGVGGDFGLSKVLRSGLQDPPEPRVTVAIDLDIGIFMAPS